jgi:hypothetical protein
MRGLMPAGPTAMCGSMPCPSNASMKPTEKKPLSPPRVVGVNPSRRRARCSNAKHPAVSDATERKISVSKLAVRALTIGPLTAVVVLNTVTTARAQAKPRITPTAEEIAAWSREGGLPALGSPSCRHVLWLAGNQPDIKA